MMRITARVPATVANLGPGFDCLGLAVGLYTDVTLETGTGRAGMEITGELADLPQSVIEEQVHNGVAVRMAVLASALGVAG